MECPVITILHVLSDDKYWTTGSADAIEMDKMVML